MPRWGAALTCLGLVSTLSAAAPGPSATGTVPDACSPIPEGEDLISGLTSGQVVHDGGATTLRFADQAFGCDDWPGGTTAKGCVSHWTYRLTLS